MAKSHIDTIFKSEASGQQAVKETKYIEDVYFKDAIPVSNCLFSWEEKHPWSFGKWQIFFQCLQWTAA